MTQFQILFCHNGRGKFNSTSCTREYTVYIYIYTVYPPPAWAKLNYKLQGKQPQAMAAETRLGIQEF